MKKQTIANVPPKPATLKRITPKVKEAATELFDLQRQINRVAARMAALKVQEEEVLERLAPVFDGLKESTKFSIPQTAGKMIEVRYTYVDRLVTDNTKVERLLTSLGKAVPKTHNTYSFLKAVAVKVDEQ